MLRGQTGGDIRMTLTMAHRLAPDSPQKYIVQALIRVVNTVFLRGRQGLSFRAIVHRAHRSDSVM